MLSIMIGWAIGVLGILIGLFGGIKFIMSLRRVEGKLRTSLLCLVIASVIYVMFGSVMVVFGLFEIPLTEIYWEIIPVMFTISTIFFVVGAYNFLNPIEEFHFKGKYTKHANSKSSKPSSRKIKSSSKKRK